MKAPFSCDEQRSGAFKSDGGGRVNTAPSPKRRRVEMGA